jgi:hypothetical protein
MEVRMTIQPMAFDDEPADYYEDDIEPDKCDCELCQPAGAAA